MYLLDRDGLYADRPEWAEKRKEVLKAAKSIADLDAAHSLVQEAADVAGGKHSFLWAPVKDTASYPESVPEVEMLEGGIIHALLPGHTGVKVSDTLYIRTVFDYLQEHPGLYCVLSGGKGENEKISEAECMFRYMTARGIEPDRILCEDRSTSTRENLLFSLQILREKGLLDIRDVALVTNEFHACRAHLIAKKLGLKAGTVPAASPWWLLPSFYVRELFGLLYQIFL